MRRLHLLFLLLLPAFPCGAADYHAEIHSALRYLVTMQAPTNGDYVAGEWPTEVKSILLPGLVGAGVWGRRYPEATNFTTAAIVEVLGEMHQLDPSLRLIPRMTQKAVQGFDAYFQDPLFNFYPPKMHRGVSIRGPRSMFLASYIRGMANVPADADSTSMSYLALNHYELQRQGRSKMVFIKRISPAVFETFSNFRDMDRQPHHYNRRHGYHSTGAFMTWLMDEIDPAMPGLFTPPEAGPRIPFGRNDVDCVVNTNVMKLLTWAEKTAQPGYQKTCDYLKTTIDKMDYGRCGIYYPNRYAEILGLAQLKTLKARCLESHFPIVLSFVSGTQDADGGWTNMVESRADRLQSTVLALNALMLLGDHKNPTHRRQVNKGIQFLLRSAQKDSHGNLYWKGQVFFAAVSQARFTVVWRSSSYTTALAAKALLMAERF